MGAATSTPTVFVSYSHDDPDHKRWVLALATYLRENGVEVLLDTWDLRPGDDVPKFMERGVRDADRVLMICTEAYVVKANDGLGGVGYEAMIVTGELVRDLGTAKFIPVVRQKNQKPQVPTSVSTRLYINLSDWPESKSEIERLLQELHDVRPPKPPLGTYSRAAEPADGATRAAEPPATVSADSFTDPAVVFQRALVAARANDLLEWRRVVRNARTEMGPRLSAWWAKYATTAPPTPELVEQSMEGASAFAPLTAIALAGVASANPTFQQQTGLLEDILNPAEWQRSGFDIRIELPEAGAFLYQALHGAMCLQASNLTAAMRLAREEFLNRNSGGNLPLWKHHNIVAWPLALGRSAITAWDMARNLPARWPWVAELFGDSSEYQAGLYAYYVSLNVLEYVERLREGHSPLLPTLDLFRADVPPVFEGVDEDVKRRGYRLAASEGPAFRALWTSMKIDEAVVRSQWGSWITLQRGLVRHFYPFGAEALGFERLIYDVLGS
jgi:TIR domain-containing protein